MMGGFLSKKDPTGRIVIPGWSQLGYPVETGNPHDRSYTTLAQKRHTAQNLETPID